VLAEVFSPLAPAHYRAVFEASALDQQVRAIVNLYLVFIILVHNSAVLEPLHESSLRFLHDIDAFQITIPMN
jgi:hypothetical protein